MLTKSEDSASRMPDVYRPPFGLPFYWRDEASGELARAVMAYLDNQTVGGRITEEQITLVREYLAHWANAPCWDHREIATLEQVNDAFPELGELRRTVSDLKTADQIHDWLMLALDIGMDPL